MTVKPQEVIEEEEKITKDPKKDGHARSGGFNCCVIL
jgi:hypothetical protein